MLLVLLSPDLTQRPSDAEVEETRERALKAGKLLPNPKVKMGWYKVPRSSFDYAPASLDPVLVELGVKERESLKFPLAHALHFERDARTMSLIASFLDMSGASACKVLEEASQNQELPKEAKDALQWLADLEQSRGHAVPLDHHGCQYEAVPKV